MLEVRGDAHFAQEAVGAEHGGEVGPQDLDRHLAVVPRIVGEVDGGHPALPELTLDGVAVGEGLAKLVRDVHRSTADERNGLT